MKRLIALLVSVIVAGWLVGTYGFAEVKSADNDAMKKKLEYSKNILAGLTTENFDLILKNAKALNQLGQQQWSKNESIEYRTQHQVFWFANDTLILAAEDKNIDGATLSYTQMTFSCVNCHQLLRKQ
jgi:hypothetical protein